MDGSYADVASSLANSNFFSYSFLGIWLLWILFLLGLLFIQYKKQGFDKLKTKWYFKVEIISLILTVLSIAYLIMFKPLGWF